MDKRTLLFVVALTLALFGVNIYFDSQRDDSLRQWNEEYKTKQATKLKQLEIEISKYSAEKDTLPIVELYADSEETQLLTRGIKSDQAILTLAWGDPVPEIIYAKDKNGSLEKFKLKGDKKGPILYLKEGSDSLSIAELPEFGNYYLQLVSLKNEASSSVILGHYVDGNLTFPVQQANEIKEQQKSSTFPVTEPIPEKTIALMKTLDGYLPVAIYDANDKSLISLRDIKKLPTKVAKANKAEKLSSEKAEEQFYVLESPYQQLVFSNYGGALAEINLPFASATNKQSVVREIEFDREMVKDHPYNAHFPAHSYFTAKENGNLEEHSKGAVGGYYPLLRRDLILPKNKKSIRIDPRYYALNIVSEYPEVAELVYEVKHFDQQSIVFEATQSHRRITKTYSIDASDKAAPYLLNLTVKIEGDNRGLWITSGIPEVEWISGSPAPTLKYRITRQQKAAVEQIDLPQDSSTVNSVFPDWICNSNGFLGMILDPLSKAEPGYRVQKVMATAAPSRLMELNTDSDRFKADDMPGYLMALPIKSGNEEMHLRIFAGPFATDVLKTVDQTYSDPATGYNPDYIACQSFHGWFAFISEPFAKFLFVLMRFFHQMTGSWAFSIILLTVALRIMMYPLNAWSSKSMVRMQQIGPEVAAIQAKYKSDPKKAQLEVLNLYREKGVNPMSGCLPMLLQMPFLIGMFDLLKSTFELRGASFIPGWIDDLASPDVLFSWKTSLPFIGNQFHLLPILLGVVMFLQQRLMSTAPSDPALMTDQQRQQRSMGTVMSIVFTIMFYHFPSGLNIYWLSSMLLGILQQWWTNKRLQNVVPAPATVEIMAKPRKKT